MQAVSQLGSMLQVQMSTGGSPDEAASQLNNWIEKLGTGDALKAALEAGYTRFRPVCMTALAMIIGMLPLALSEEQNAPLGRAVIGGLLLATVATLIFVPVVFSLVHGRPPHSAVAGENTHVA
mgnify:CR=1 FL=1